MSTVAKSMKGTHCHALRFVGYSGVSFKVHVLCTLFPVCHSPCLWKILHKILGTYFVNYFRFTSLSTISNAMLFSTNLSYICAHIQAFSKFKLMYLPIIKALQKYFFKNFPRVLPKHFFYECLEECAAVL